MSISDEIKKQLRAGQGIRFDASANALFRAVGRKEAQEDADADKLAKLDADAKKAGDDAKAEQAEIDSMGFSGPLPPDITEVEQLAYDSFLSSLKARTSKKRDLEARKAGKEKEATKIRAYHATLGEQKILHEDPKSLLLRDLKQFIERNAGPSCCMRCCELIEAHLEANPDAVLVKIKGFDGDAAGVYTADGKVVCRVSVAVKSR